MTEEQKLSLRAYRQLIRQMDAAGMPPHSDYWGQDIDEKEKAIRKAFEPKEISDAEVFELMRPALDLADGGYVCDTAPNRIIEAGRALLDGVKKK